MSTSLERLEELRRLIEINKASSRVRAQRNLSRMITIESRKMMPYVRRFLDTMIKRIKAGLPAAARTRKPSTFVKVLTDWKKLEEEGKAYFKKPVLAAIEAGGKAVFNPRLRKQDIVAEGFDPSTTSAIDWAEDHAAELVTLITEETMQAIRSYVKEALAEGKDIGKIAREIRPLVGLTEPHILAVGRRYAELIAQDLPMDRVEALTARYANKLHNYRSQMIARTETAYGLNEGVVESYDQMGVKRLEWVADADCCDYCDEQNGETFSIEEAHGLQPAHPNCECTWVAA